MPDGTRHTDPRIDRCAQLMTGITRHWAELDASGPRAGPVRDAISRLEPVIFAQMTVAMEHWVRAIARDGTEGPHQLRLARLAAQIMTEGDGDPESGAPHLTSIDFVQLWPKVIKELREGP